MVRIGYKKDYNSKKFLWMAKWDLGNWELDQEDEALEPANKYEMVTFRIETNKSVVRKLIKEFIRRINNSKEIDTQI